MKKILFASALILPLLFGSCKQKENTENTQPETEQTTEESNSSYMTDPTSTEVSTVEENLSGNVIQLTSSEFIERICDVYDTKGFAYKGHTPCLVDFYANWCGPCMKLKPTIEKLAKEYKGEFIVYSVNVDRAQEICDVLDIQSIPTLVLFSRTKQPAKIVGFVEESELKTAINDYIAK